MAFNLKESLGKKIGPLPAVAWVGMVAVVYVVYRYIQASKAKGVASSVPSTDGTLGDALSSGFGGGGGGTAVGSSLQTPSTSPTDNFEWGKDAANSAIAYGYDPSIVQQVISDYLNGTGSGTLNTQQSAILNWILKKWGTPPGGVISPPPTVPTPVTTPAPVPTPSPPVSKPPDKPGWYYDPTGKVTPTPPTGAPQVTYWDPSGTPHSFPSGTPTPLGWYDAPPSTWGR